MRDISRKTRIENILKETFAPIMLVVRDDSKNHEGHSQVPSGSEETHFFIKMKLDKNNTMSKLNLHRKVYTLLESEFSSGLHALELDIKNA